LTTLTYLSPRPALRRSPVLKAATLTSTCRWARLCSVSDLVFPSRGPKTDTMTSVSPWLITADPSASPCCPSLILISRSSNWRLPSDRYPPSFSISTRLACSCVIHILPAICHHSPWSSCNFRKSPAASCSLTMANPALPVSILDTDLYKVCLLLDTHDRPPSLCKVDNAASHPPTFSRRAGHLSLYKSQW